MCPCRITKIVTKYFTLLKFTVPIIEWLATMSLSAGCGAINSTNKSNQLFRVYGNEVCRKCLQIKIQVEKIVQGLDEVEKEVL